jgi:hypothetical protein
MQPPAEWEREDQFTPGRCNAVGQWSRLQAMETTRAEKQADSGSELSA